MARTAPPLQRAARHGFKKLDLGWRAPDVEQSRFDCTILGTGNEADCAEFFSWILQVNRKAQSADFAILAHFASFAGLDPGCHVIAAIRSHGLLVHVRHGLLLSHDCRVHRAWHFWYTHACISRQRDRKAQQYKKKQTGDTHKSITQHFYFQCKAGRQIDERPPNFCGINCRCGNWPGFTLFAIRRDARPQLRRAGHPLLNASRCWWC